MFHVLQMLHVSPIISSSVCSPKRTWRKYKLRCLPFRNVLAQVEIGSGYRGRYRDHKRESGQQRNSIPGIGKDFFLPQSSSVGNEGVFPWTEWPGREADDSHHMVSRLRLEELYLHATLYHHIYDQGRLVTSYVEIFFSSLMLKRLTLTNN